MVACHANDSAVPVHEAVASVASDDQVVPFREVDLVNCLRELLPGYDGWSLPSRGRRHVKDDSENKGDEAAEDKEAEIAGFQSIPFPSKPRGDRRRRPKASHGPGHVRCWTW